MPLTENMINKLLHTKNVISLDTCVIDFQAPVICCVRVVSYKVLLRLNVFTAKPNSRNQFVSLIISLFNSAKLFAHSSLVGRVYAIVNLNPHVS